MTASQCRVGTGPGDLPVDDSVLGGRTRPDSSSMRPKTSDRICCRCGPLMPSAICSSVAGRSRHDLVDLEAAQVDLRRPRSLKPSSAAI